MSLWRLKSRIVPWDTVTFHVTVTFKVTVMFKVTMMFKVTFVGIKERENCQEMTVYNSFVWQQHQYKVSKLQLLSPVTFTVTFDGIKHEITLRKFQSTTILWVGNNTNQLMMKQHCIWDIQRPTLIITNRLKNIAKYYYAFHVFLLQILLRYWQ